LILFKRQACEDYLYWQIKDKNTQMNQYDD